MEELGDFGRTKNDILDTVFLVSSSHECQILYEIWKEHVQEVVKRVCILFEWPTTRW